MAAVEGSSTPPLQRPTQVVTSTTLDRQLANMLSVADYQKKFDEISEIRQAAKNDYTISNARKREIAEEFSAARKDLHAASAAAMATAAKVGKEQQGPFAIDKAPDN